MHRNPNQHNHNRTPDPFTLAPYTHRRPGLAAAKEMAKIHWGILLYLDSKEILQKIGLCISRKEYYNLVKKEAIRTLNSYKEAQYIL